MFFSACMILFSSTAFAAQEDDQPISTKTITFDEQNYSGLTAIETGKQKLLDNGYTQEYVDSIPDNNLEKIATATSAEQSILYFKENGLDDNGNPILQKITKSEFTMRQNSSLENVVANCAKKIAVVDDKGKVIYPKNNYDS